MFTGSRKRDSCRKGHTDRNSGIMLRETTDTGSSHKGIQGNICPPSLHLPFLNIGWIQLEAREQGSLYFLEVSLSGYIGSGERWKQIWSGILPFPILSSSSSCMSQFSKHHHDLLNGINQKPALKLYSCRIFTSVIYKYSKSPFILWNIHVHTILSITATSPHTTVLSLQPTIS